VKPTANRARLHAGTSVRGTDFYPGAVPGAADGPSATGLERCRRSPTPGWLPRWPADTSGERRRGAAPRIGRPWSARMGCQNTCPTGKPVPPGLTGMSPRAKGADEQQPTAGGFVQRPAIDAVDGRLSEGHPSGGRGTRPFDGFPKRLRTAMAFHRQLGEDGAPGSRTKPTIPARLLHQISRNPSIHRPSSGIYCHQKMPTLRREHLWVRNTAAIVSLASWGCQAEGNTPDDGTASILAVDTSGRPMGGIPLRHRGAGIVTIVATTDQSGWATVPLDDEMEIDPYLWGSFPRAVTIQPGSTAVLVMPRTCLVEVEISGPHLDPDEELIAAFESQGWPFSQSLVVLKGKGDQRIQGRVPCGSTNISIEGPKLHAPVRLHDEQVEDGWRFEGSLDPGRLVEATVVDSHGAPLADIFLGEAGFTHARTNREGRVVARIDSRGDRELRMVSPSFKPYPIPVSAGKNNINLGTIVMTTKR